MGKPATVLNCGLHGMGVTRSILVMLCVLAAACTAAAQTANVILKGEVRDPNGDLIVGATVTATNTQTGIRNSAVTDEGGRYTILSLPPSHYDVQAAQTGFATAARRDQEFLIGTNVVLDFTLQVSSLQQEIEVTGEAPILQSTQSTLAGILQTRELDDLPILSRSFANLAALTPGVQVNAAGAVGIGNNPTYETGFMVDGGSNEKSFGGGQYVTFAQDWVQEFSVMTNQFPAEYGSAAGGIVSAITRSGTNQVHGRAYGYFQDAALNATPSFLPKSAPNKPAFNNKRLGGMIGGPIKKEKLFYFVGFESYRSLTSVPINLSGAAAAFANPSLDAAGGVFPQTSTSNYAMLKFDYHPNANNSYNLRINFDGTGSTNNGIGAAGSTISTLGVGTSSFNPNDSDSLIWTRTLSARSINELRLVFDKNQNNSTCNYGNFVGAYQGGGANATPFGNPTGWWARRAYAPSGVVVGCGVTFGTAVGGESVFHVYDTFTRATGNHELKIGGELVRIGYYGTNVHNNLDGQYSIVSSVPFNPANSATFPTSYFVTDSNPPSLMSFILPWWWGSVFVQDSWKVTPNLTLNPGLRYDFSTANSSLSSSSFPALKQVFPDAHGFIQPGFHSINNDMRDFAPRLGIAWTPFHDDKRTVVRGGVGVYYDQNHAGSAGVYATTNSTITYSANFNATNPSLNSWCLGTPAAGFPTCVAGAAVPAVYANAMKAALAYALANYTVPNLPPAGTTISLGGQSYTLPPLPTIPGPNGTPVPAPTQNVFDIDPTYRVPASLQGTVGVQHQLGSSLNISADFVYIRGFNGIILRNINISKQDTVINPKYTTILSFGNGVYSAAKHLLVHASYRDRRGDALQVAYTFGYASDDSISGFQPSSHSIPATNPFDYSLDYGPSPTDARHILNVSGSFKVHWGIQLSPLVSYTSALPYTATTTAGPGSALAAPNCQPYFTQCYPAGYTRDSLRGGGTFSLNSRLSKSIRLGEGRSVMLLFEGYNLTNTLNTGTNYVSNVASAAFKTAIAQATARRQLQAGFRFDF